MTVDDKADIAFNVYDKNHDGYVTKNEMLKGSKHLTKQQVTQRQCLWNIWRHFCVVPFQVDAVFERNDSDHDGKLTREEFQGFMRRNSKDLSDRRDSKK